MVRTAKKETTKKNSEEKIILKYPFSEIWITLDQTREVIAAARTIELAKLNLSLENSRILHKLAYDNGQTTVDEICKFTLRSHHAVYTLLRRMEKIGVIKKIRSGQSNKITIVMTEKGKDLYANNNSRAIEMIFTSLTEEERRYLLSSLKKLNSATRSLLGLDYMPPFL